jgi:hypothetical protein
MSRIGHAQKQKPNSKSPYLAYALNNTSKDWVRSKSPQNNKTISDDQVDRHQRNFLELKKLYRKKKQEYDHFLKIYSDSPKINPKGANARKKLVGVPPGVVAPQYLITKNDDTNKSFEPRTSTEAHAQFSKPVYIRLTPERRPPPGRKEGINKTVDRVTLLSRTQKIRQDSGGSGEELSIFTPLEYCSLSTSQDEFDSIIIENEAPKPKRLRPSDTATKKSRIDNRATKTMTEPDEFKTLSYKRANLTMTEPDDFNNNSYKRGNLTMTEPDDFNNTSFKRGNLTMTEPDEYTDEKPCFESFLNTSLQYFHTNQETQNKPDSSQQKKTSGINSRTCKLTH